MAITLQAKSDAPISDAMSEAMHVLHTAADPRVYVRDEIVVDEAFVKRVQAIAAGFAKGTTLKLAARKIKHEQGVVLRVEGYPLMIAADSYDGNGGAIDTSGSAGAAGKSGFKGSPGKALANSTPGGTGGHGKNGDPGTSASPLTLVAYSVHDLRLIAEGGAGGHGGSGGEGGDGAEAIYGKVDRDGSKGGSGGDGGDGGVGGDAAQIKLYTAVPTHSVELHGGGGHAGLAGLGGKVGSGAGVGPTPHEGNPGKSGKPGASVPPEQALLRPGPWWAKARATLASARWQWADHRTRVGKYRWRVEGNAPAALVEFDAAVTLVQHAEADRLRKYIHADLTPLGVAYDHDLKPDFSMFEEVITDYGPMVQSLTTVATSLLLHAADVSNNKSKLEQELASVEGLQSVQDAAIASAQVGNAFALGELELNKMRIDTLIAELKAVEKEMKEQGVDPLETVLGVATALVAVVGAAYSGGATLAALPAAFGLIADATKVLESKIWDAKAGEYDINGKSLGEWKDSQEYKDMVAGIEGFVDKAKLFYDKAKVVADLFDTDVDDETAKRHKDLTIQLAELEFQRRLLELKKLQAGLALDSAIQVKHVAEQDQQAIEQLAANLGSDLAILAGLAGRLMRSAQVYVDLYTQYAFFAARALDLYTLEDHYAPTFYFGLGYIHPDHEADALLLVDDGQKDQFIALVAEYQETVSTLPDPFLLKPVYDAYDADLTTVQHQYWNFTDPEILDALRTTGQAAVRIPLSSIPTSRSELKILQVYLSLTGAVGENETILVALEHTGNAENRKQSSPTPIILSAPPRRSIVAATVDASLLDPIGDQKFWGRSPTALWRLTIDPSETAVNLDGLTEIQLVVDYKCAEGGRRARSA